MTLTSGARFQRVHLTQIKETGKNTAWADEIWGRIVGKVRSSSARIGDRFPHVARTERYEFSPPHWWTSGFWPGLLWLVYREERDQSLRDLAESCEKQMDASIWEYDNLHHDVGFMWSLTSVARFKLLGSEDSRRRAMIAASLLASRFNLRGRYIRAWNEDKGWDGDTTGWSIVDCLMNLPLLYWASDCIGDPRFEYVATAHADTALQHFLRPDGSCRHIVSFDHRTGEFRGALGGQGFSPESAWARGLSWAMYGFALSYRYTKAPRYLEGAERAARFFIEHLPPGGIPPWDFGAPDAPDGPRDSSAAACAASGLVELAALVPPERAGYYLDSAVRLIRALDEKCGRWEAGHDALLGQATGDRPRNVNVEVSLIYGDYFFAEAVGKLRGNRELFW